MSLLLQQIASRMAESNIVGFDPIILVINSKKLYEIAEYYVNVERLHISDFKTILGLIVVKDDRAPDFFVVDNRSWVYQKF